VEGIDLEAYKDILIERFGNPNVKDKLSRICLKSSAKLPTFLIPTITENLDRGGRIECAVLVIAAWCLYSDKGVNRHGGKLDIVDEKKEALHEAAKLTGKDKLAFLKLTSVFGDLIQNERFTKLYSEMIDAVYKDPDISLQMQTFLSEGEKGHRRLYRTVCYCQPGVRRNRPQYIHSRRQSLRLDCRSDAVNILHGGHTRQRRGQYGPTTTDSAAR
jgi:hypothetical protein